MSDEAAIEETVRAFLEATAAGGTRTGLVTGPFGRWLALVESALPGDLEDRGTLDVHRLEVAHVDGDQAVVDVEAVVDLDRVHPRLGRQREALRIEGPVVLERVDGSWRLLDWTSNGRRALDGLFPEARGRAEAGGVDAEVLAARASARSTLLAVRVRNDTGEELRFRSASVSQARRGRLRGYSPATIGTDPVATGESIRVVYAPGVAVAPAPDLLLALELEGDDERIALLVPVSPRGAEPQAVDTPPLGLKVRRWLSPLTIALLLMLGGAVALAALVSWTSGGLFALFLAGFLVWAMRRWVRALGARSLEVVGPMLAAAAALLVLGVFALAHG